MYVAWVHSKEQQKVLEDRHERLQRDEKLEKSWKSIGIPFIQAFYQIVRLRDRTILIPHLDGTQSDQNYKSNQYLRALDAYSQWQNGRLANALSGTTPPNVSRIRHFILHNLCLQMINQQVLQNVNSHLVKATYKFYASYLGSTKILMAPEEPTDLYTRKIFNLMKRLPIEIQLMILEMLPLHRGDLEVRLFYPYLIPRWIETVPVRFTRYFTRLCSTGNMDYVGRYYRSDVTEEEVEEEGFYADGVDVYRLKSLDYHSMETSRLRIYLALPENKSKRAGDTEMINQVDHSALKGASTILRRQLEKLFISDRDNTLRKSQSVIGFDESGDDIVPFSCSREHWIDISTRWGLGCQTCTVQLPARPFLIPLSFSCRQFQCKPGKVSDQYLLIFEDELSEIFKNMTIAWRPIFWQEDPVIHFFRDDEQEEEFACWMDEGCSTVGLGGEEHDS
ncbi:hypothetical protein ONS95_010648 [Cadophora gregata]|uniref:uncharacterized protein n=1 Tax=Cadophora gregata TaxID=51156 RepID=UPI0026DB40D6|nr:uncharacterized protein ONS95_010648 [Cadophora gregata]KAK0122409.1 hypothetical protein ONS95_010648 [Cadophora gregata]KAK0127888.1 hypothetical protein ONS96_007388 [Cadophora gregata f. sp. sojae]